MTMRKPFSIISFAGISLIVLSTSCFAQQKDTIKIQEGFVGMVGYGSLMSLKSMESTLGHQYSDSSYLIHLKGFIRAWTSYRPLNDPMANSPKAPQFYGFILQNNDSIPFDGIVQLNVESQENSKINCILYLISKEDIINFDKREVGYERIDVTDRIEEFTITGGRVYVYQQAPNYYDKTTLNLAKFILIEDYVNMITQACDGIGENFRIEFDKSTVQPSSQVVPSQKIGWKIVK
jgi:hypothetical protein